MFIGRIVSLHKKSINDQRGPLSEPGAVATGQRFTLRIVVRSVRLSLGPVATTTPRGLPARGARSAPGSDR